MTDAWDPAQYQRFRREREAPFHDLLAGVRPRADGRRVLDLGCGTGALTAHAHAQLGAASTIGVDDSHAMLAAAAAYQGGGVTFQRARIEDVVQDTARRGRFDLVLSNAALHWVADHEALWPKLWSLLAPGGQLAVQMPANHDHPSHTAVDDIAADFAAVTRPRPVAAPERYAALCIQAGCVGAPRVRLEVYSHLLDSVDEVVEWTRGTTLTPFRAVLDDVTYQRFVTAYRDRLRATLPDRRPFLYTFKRLFIWAERPG